MQIFSGQSSLIVVIIGVTILVYLTTINLLKINVIFTLIQIFKNPRGWMRYIKAARNPLNAENLQKISNILNESGESFSKKIKRSIETAAKNRAAFPIYHLTQKASEYERKNNLKGALALWKVIEILREDKQKAQYGMACCLYKASEAEHDIDKKKQLVNEACKKLELLIEHNPAHIYASYFWGCSLIRLADMTDILAQKKELLISACDKFESIIKYQNRHFLVWSMWSCALMKLAEIEDTTENKQQLLRDTGQKLEMAIRCKQKFAEAWNDWGTSLMMLGETVASKEHKRELLEQAVSKYESAIKYNGALTQSWNNMGSVLIRLAALEEDENKKNLLLQAAMENCQRAESILEGTGSYNLACIAAIRGDKNTCRMLLEKRKSVLKYLPTAKDIEDDKHLDIVQNEEWFKEFIAYYRKGRI